MKILANLVGLVKRTDSNLPFGKTIQDETDTQLGTPIVADLMQDFFSNFYRILELTKTTPTNDFDSNLTQYQLIDALKKLPNSINDCERVLTLTDTVWATDLDLSILPNKFFFLARATDNYIPETEFEFTDYTFKGTGIEEYSFVSQDNFVTGSLLLVVIDTGGVRAYPLGYNPPKYKVYTALLTQSGTDAPTAIILDNTIGDIIWSRISEGSYLGTLLGAFPETKYFALCPSNMIGFDAEVNNGGGGNTYNYVRVDDNTIALTIGTDEGLINTPIEIKVYN